jgi:hypothetical protein
VALELDGVRRVVERLLDDSLEVWRDADGAADDVLDEETGELRPGAGAADLVWAGHGAVVLPGQLAFAPPADSSVAWVVAPTVYRALLPLDSPAVKADDTVKVVQSVRDPQLACRRFRVAEVAVGSYAVVRMLRLEVIG